MVGEVNAPMTGSSEEHHGDSIAIKDFILSLLGEKDRATDKAFAAQEKAVDAAFAAQEKAVQAALVAQEKAVQAALLSATTATNKAEINYTEWRQSANEWRAAMDDRERKFVPRDEYTAVIKGLEEKISGKNVQVFLSLAVGFVAILIAVFNFASSQ